MSSSKSFAHTAIWIIHSILFCLYHISSSFFCNFKLSLNSCMIFGSPSSSSQAHTLALLTFVFSTTISSTTLIHILFLLQNGSKIVTPQTLNTTNVFIKEMPNFMSIRYSYRSITHYVIYAFRYPYILSSNLLLYNRSFLRNYHFLCYRQFLCFHLFLCFNSFACFSIPTCFFIHTNFFVPTSLFIFACFSIPTSFF